MKQALIGLAIIIAIGGYVWWSMSNASTSSGTATTTTETPLGSGTSAPSESINPASVGTTAPTMTTPTIGGVPAPTPVVTPAPASGYKNGAFTGPVVESVYGPVQVVATISGGKITSVAVPVFPNSPGNTTVISNRSLPILKQETITAQSAKVDNVSGATQTSDAFRVSLSAALSLAS
ncbi:MAG: FMN-binding protein [Parcubacteria group bacterium]|nr:FMN-binding protein [Parcubacteria group bacterium]